MIGEVVQVELTPDNKFYVTIEVSNPLSPGDLLKLEEIKEPLDEWGRVGGQCL